MRVSEGAAIRVYRVCAFDKENFVAALTTAKFPAALVEADSHATYLHDYLADPEMCAKTIIIEPEYVDGDFLEDFAAYYVTCFEPFERYCRRVHFFSSEFDEKRFEELLLGNVDDKSLNFRDGYLGFIVIKPLPDTIIGRTQLKTYGSDSNRRQYTALIDYVVHLCGIRLDVRSLAFQEQDSVLAACATVALWSCFQKTADLFGTAAPRPPKITRDATLSVYDRRALPSEGLYIEQICSAVRSNGLDPEVFGRKATLEMPIASLIYGYLKMGLPVLLVVDIHKRGLHAVTLSGYSLRETNVHVTELVRDPDDDGEPFPALPGLRIDEFYAHDDQHGPFSRLKIVAPTKLGEPIKFIGAWKDESNAPLVMTPTQVIIPVYNKIRLTYIDAFQWLLRIQPLVEFISEVADKKAFSWDLYLTTSNIFKHELRKNGHFPERRRLHLLKKPQPRFFWKAKMRASGHAMFEMLIDATGFSKSFPIFEMTLHDEDLARKFRQLIERLDHPAITPFRTFFEDAGYRTPEKPDPASGAGIVQI